MFTQRFRPLQMPPSDIDTFASFVEGFDAEHYYDSQLQGLREAAAQRWPLMATVLFPELGTAPR